MIIALSIVVKGEVAKETVNHGTKTRAYVPIWARTKQTFIGLENTLQNAFSVTKLRVPRRLKDVLQGCL